MNPIDDDGAYDHAKDLLRRIRLTLALIGADAILSDEQQTLMRLALRAISDLEARLPDEDDPALS